MALDADLAEVTSAELAKLAIAYEPIWAIGTGVTATPEQAQETVAFCRRRVRERFGDAADGVRILYGGSVKPDNTDALMAEPDLDGALVGGASLDAAQFTRNNSYFQALLGHFSKAFLRQLLLENVPQRLLEFGEIFANLPHVRIPLPLPILYGVGAAAWVAAALGAWRALRAGSGLPLSPRATPSRTAPLMNSPVSLAMPKTP